MKRNGNAAGVGEWEMPIQSQAEAEAAQNMSKLTGGLNLGGLF